MITIKTEEPRARSPPIPAGQSIRGNFRHLSLMVPRDDCFIDGDERSGERGLLSEDAGGAICAGEGARRLKALASRHTL